MMKTSVTEENGMLIAAFEGRLDTAAAPQTEKDLAQVCENKDLDIVLDCTKLDYISSSGLRIFLSILKLAKANGRHVSVVGLNDDLRNVFSMTGFINLFDIK